VESNGIPQDDGKIVVAGPALAAALAELAEENADRIYTMENIPEHTAYVIDLDVLADFIT
jgi:hypothetical protein